MKKHIIRVGILSLLAVAIAGAPVSIHAQNAIDKTAAEKPEAKTGRSGVVPFNGKIKKIDKEAKTFLVGERTFHLSSETKIMKAGKPATIADAVVGEDAGGAFKRTEDGKLMVTTVRFGPKSEAEAEPAKEPARKQAATAKKE